MIAARTTRTTRAIPYYGSKARLAPWIIGHFPPHTCYVDVFGGSGAVLLSKPPSTLEVFNDLNDDVVCFFDVLRADPDRLIRALRLTPFSRAELRRAGQPCGASDTFERARRFYVRSWQTMGGPREGDAEHSWRYQRGAGITGRLAGRTNVHQWCAAPEALWPIAERLRHVQIERRDAFDVIPRYDTPATLFYCDPPYPRATRTPRWATSAYTRELSDDDHIRLADLLHHIRGAAAISGYRCPLYDRLYADWPLFTRTARKNSHAGAVECLWLSPRAATAVRQPPLPLTTAA